MFSSLRRCAVANSFLSKYRRSITSRKKQALVSSNRGDSKDREKQIDRFTKKIDESEETLDDPIFHEWQQEIAKLKSQFWLNFHQSDDPMSAESIQTGRKQLQQKIDQVSQKYREVLAEKKLKEAREMASSINANEKEFLADPGVHAISQMFEEKTGQGFHGKQFTDEELGEFIEWIDSEEGDEFAKSIESSIPDEKLKELGIDIEAEMRDFKEKFNITDDTLFRPSPSSPQQQNTGKIKDAARENNTEEKEYQKSEAASPSHPDINQSKLGQLSKEEVISRLYDKDSMENFKHYLKKEAHKNPYMAELFEKEFNTSVDQIADEFDELVKNGKIAERLSPDEIFQLMKGIK